MSWRLPAVAPGRQPGPLPTRPRAGQCPRIKSVLSGRARLLPGVGRLTASACPARVLCHGSAASGSRRCRRRAVSGQVCCGAAPARPARPRRRASAADAGRGRVGVAARGSVVVQCRSAPASTSICALSASRSSSAKRRARSRAAQRSESAELRDALRCAPAAPGSRSASVARSGSRLQPLELVVQLVAVRAEPLEEAEGLLEGGVLGHARVQRVLGGPHRRAQLQPQLGQFARRRRAGRRTWPAGWCPRPCGGPG